MAVCVCMFYFIRYIKYIRNVKFEVILRNLEMKKILLAGASLLALSYTTPAFTNDTDKVVNATGNLVIDTINKRGIFEWINGGIGYSDKTLSWDITTFSNLSETKDMVTYLQTSYNRQKSVNRLHLGLGYRKLINTTSAPLIVGVNAFFDTKDGTKNILALKSSENFQRYSIGAELKTARFDMSANLYRRIGNNIVADKKVLQGWDMTAKGNIPNYENISVGINTYKFDGVGNTVVKGNKLIAEFKPNPVITVRGEYDRPSGESAQTDISVDFKLAFDKPIQDQMKSAPVSGAGTVWHKRYDKVERQYDIKTAEAESTPTLPVVSAGTIDSSSGKTIASGDGKTEATAFVLPDNNKFAIKKFIDAPTDAVRAELNSRTAISPTVAVTVTVMRGTLGTEFAFEDSAGNPIDNIKDVDYESVLVDKTGSNTAVLKLSYQVSGYAPQDVFVKTTESFTDTVTMGDLIVPYASGNKTVSAADILAKLTVSGGQTQASEWMVKNLTDTDNHANLAVASGGKILTISGAITTKTTVTVNLAHPKYQDVTKTFELSTATGALNSGTHTGSGKWGQSYTTDYKLKTSDTVGDTTVTFDTNADFTFEIVAPATTVSGFTSTTAGIVNGALTGAINANTGGIIGANLTKSGTLLVKIVRKAKGGLPQITDYANLPVAKQTTADHTGFTVSASPIVWATASTAVPYTATNAPFGIGIATYTLTATGTTAGNAITIASNTGAIAKTTQSGVVKVKITYAANDKYESMTRDVDVSVNKQTIADNTLSVANLVVTYVSGNKVVSAADVLGQLTATGSARSDWTVKSLVKKDTNSNFDIDSGGKSLTIKGTFTTSTTVTVVFESTKYTDVSKDFELSTRAAQVIDGTPTGLSGKWGKGTVTPDYKLDLTDQGQTFVKATDYTFSVVPSSDGGKGGKDATTAGIFTSNPISNARTGAIDTSKLTKSGKLLIKIVRAAKGSGANTVAAATEYVNFDVTKQVLGTDVTTAPAVATATGESGKWKTSASAKINLNYTLPGSTDESDYTWAVGKKSGAEPDGTLAIDSRGDISGATSSGTAEITIIAKANNPKYTGSIRTADFTIAKQVFGTDVLAAPAVAATSSEDGKWKSDTSAKIALNYFLPGRTPPSQYTWAVKSATSRGPSGTLAIDASGHISGATSGGTAEITITAKAANKKYSGAMRTADFVIQKQTATGTLSVANVVVPYSSGDKAVSTADIESQLSVTGTQKSDWKLKSLADTDTIGASTLVIAGDKKRLTIKKQITTPTTITAVFESTKYEDKSDTFELSTRLSQVIDGTPTGVSAKWGKGTVTPDYKLKNRDAGQPFDKATDYTFSVVAAGTTVNGFTSTTANIFTSNPISNNKTGEIDSSKLVKSGTLLIKIVRAAKGSGAGAVPEATEYVNFTVNKQVFGTGANADVKTVPTVSLANGDDTKWKTGTATKFDMAYTTLPFRLSADDFTWEVAGKSGAAPSGSLAIDKDGKISGATSAGTVVITIKAKTSDEKYAGQFTLVDFAITKQKTTDTLSAANLVIPYGSGTVPVNAAAILGKLSVTSTGTAQTQKSDWQIKSVADTDNHGKLAVANDGKSLSISGVIGPSTTVTVVYEDKNNKYADETKTFELSTGAGTLSTATRTGSGKWGKTFTTDYKLKTSDTVGDVSATFNLNTDYTFSIVAPATTVTDFTSTTNGIVNGALTGAIGIRNGAIDGTKLTKSGKLLIKIVRAAKSGLPALTTYQNFDVHKQTAADHTGFSVSAGAITWNTNSQTVTYTENASKPTGIGTATYALTRTGTTAGATTGGNAITVASSDGKIAKTAQSGVVKVKITYAANDKYESITKDVDVSIGKQTATANTLSVAPIVVPYITGTSSDQTVRAVDVLLKLSVSSGSAKNDWSVKSLADTDGIGSSKLIISNDKKSMTIKGEIPTSTTVTVVFESTKYKDVTKTFELSTAAGKMSTDTPTGAGKWGKAYTTDYKLKTSDAVGSKTATFTTGSSGDFTFSIVAAGGDDGSNLTQTTADIVADGSGGNPDYAAAIDNKTGAIYGTKLTKSGTLLVKIVRAAQGDLPKLTAYQNFNVGKQDLARDIPKPTVTSTNNKWKDNGGKIPLAFVGLPSSTNFANYDWTVAGKTSDDPDTISAGLKIVSDGLTGATSGGTAIITMIAKNSDTKYTGQVTLADFTIAKQHLTDIPKPTVTSTNSKWKDNGGKIPLAFAGLPSGTNFGDYSWTVAGKTGDGPDAIAAGLKVVSNGITGATSGGTAIITMTAKSSDKKYSGNVNLADFTITKQVLGAGKDITTPPAVATATNEDGKWKTNTNAKINLNYTLPGGTTASQYSWVVGKKSGAEPSGTLKIDQTNGHISGATSSGTAEITMTAKPTNKKYTGAMRTTDFTIAKQDTTDHPNFDVTAAAIAWAAGSQTVTYTPSNAPAGIGTATYALIGSGTTAGTVAGDVGSVEVASSDGKIAKTVRSGVVKVKITYAANAKYKEITKNVDVTINKQTTTDTLTMANLVLPYASGSTTVSTATVMGKLTLSGGQTQKSDWQLKSLAGSHAGLAIAADKKSITISGAISTPTPITAIFEHKNNKYADVPKTFKLSTGAGTLSFDTRQGSGKWGKSYTTDYKLNTSDTVGDVTAQFIKVSHGDFTGDFTFSIVAAGGDDGSGLTQTTTGIVANDRYAAAINSETGAIDAKKLTKSGTLLVKIVRAAKTVTAGTLPKLTTYQNFTVNKQNLATDLDTKPSITASQADRIWKSGGAKLSGMTYNNVPEGNVTAFDWSVIGKTGDVPSGTLRLDSTDKKLIGATSGGTVIITMRAKNTDDKYTGSVVLADFTISKQNYPLKFRTSYLSPGAALNAKDIVTTKNADLDIDSKNTFGIVTPLTSAQMTLIKNQGLVSVNFETNINDVTAINSKAKRAIVETTNNRQQVRIQGQGGFKTGTESQLETQIKNDLQNGRTIFFVKPTGIPIDRVIKLKIQIRADSGKKYNAFEDIIYLVTDCTDPFYCN